MALLFAALLAAAPAPELAARERGVDAIGIPLVSFNSDTGLGIGAVGGSYIYAPGYRPFRHALAAQAFFTSYGVQNHYLRYDGPRLLGQSRLEAKLEYRRELYSPFYGAGNASAPSSPEDPTDPLHTFWKSSPGAWLKLRANPVGEAHPLQTYVGYSLRFTQVRAYAGSLLEATRPPGLEGGPSGQLWLGASWDTRDDEADPTRGGLEEVSLRLSAEPTLSRYRYAGVTFGTRRFLRLSGRAVVAQRLVVDAMYGEVPFFDWSTLGGPAGQEGIGGMSSVRGLPRQRYTGNVKVLSNTELRFYAAEFPLLRQKVRVGGLVFFDLGRAWHPNTPDGPWYAFHPAAGAGVRLARRAAVVRVDYAVAFEGLRQGLYVTFGHMF